MGAKRRTAYVGRMATMKQLAPQSSRSHAVVRRVANLMILVVVGAQDREVSAMTNETGKHVTTLLKTQSQVWAAGS